MKHLYNTFDPYHKNAKIVFTHFGDITLEPEWDRYLQSLSDKIIGLPVATEFYTVEELVKQNMVGVYTNED